MTQLEETQICEDALSKISEAGYLINTRLLLSCIRESKEALDALVKLVDLAG